jgi:cell division protein FtsQ
MSYSDASPRRRRPARGKRKKQHFFLNIFIVILVIAGLYLIGTSSIFDVKSFTIEGNRHFTTAQVIDLSGIPRGENIFTVRVSQAEERLEEDPYVRGAQVKWDLPDAISVTLEERTEDVLIAAGADSLVINFDGTILRTGGGGSKLPVVVGLTPIDPVPGIPLKVSEADLLKPCLDFFQLLDMHDFYAERLDVTAVVPRVYILDTLSIEGNLKDIEGSIEELKKVVADLLSKGIERGKISVTGTGACSFIPEDSGVLEPITIEEEDILENPPETT